MRKDIIFGEFGIEIIVDRPNYDILLEGRCIKKVFGEVYNKFLLRYDYITFGVRCGLEEVNSTLLGAHNRKLLGSEYIIFVSRKEAQFKLFYQ
jgi:hypothetical protein